jgi:hypothetical protein
MTELLATAAPGNVHWSQCNPMDGRFDTTDAIDVDSGANGANESDGTNGNEEAMGLNGAESSTINPTTSR